MTANTQTERSYRGVWITFAVVALLLVGSCLGFGLAVNQGGVRGPIFTVDLGSYAIEGYTTELPDCSPALFDCEPAFESANKPRQRFYVVWLVAMGPSPDQMNEIPIFDKTKRLLKLPVKTIDGAQRPRPLP